MVCWVAIKDYEKQTRICLFKIILFQSQTVIFRAEWKSFSNETEKNLSVVICYLSEIFFGEKEEIKKINGIVWKC